MGRVLMCFRDKWIPRPSSFKIITFDPGPKSLVSDLIDADRNCWKQDSLYNSLLPIDREAILAIPISWKGGRDFLRWHFDKKG
jgi:hypothetical protein